MRGLGTMFGSKRRIFAGKQRLREEPFCPVTTNDVGHLELMRARASRAARSSTLANTGSFGPVPDLQQKRSHLHQQWW